MNRCFFAALAMAAALAAGPASAQGSAAADPAAAAPSATCPVLLQHTFPRLQDEQPQSMCQYSGKVLLVVNTASYCSFTPQYQGLEDLHARYKERGLVVLGFPSNDFAQEKATNQEIADFCENTFGVKFPMFAKSSVRGSQANALYKQLAAQSGRAPDWNFNKYLIGRDGKLVAYYPSTTAPSERRLLAEIEKQLARPAPAAKN